LPLAALAPPVLPRGCRIVPMPRRERDERSLREDGVSQAEGPQWDEAEAQLAHSLRLLEEGHSRLEAARTRVAWAPSAATGETWPPHGHIGNRPPRSGKGAA